MDKPNTIEQGRVFLGVYKVELVDGLFVAVDRRTHMPAASFPTCREACAWCRAQPRKAKP